MVENLNLRGLSDYWFVGADGLSRQWSRKQAGELLGDMDEAEVQLRKYYDNADLSYQVVEGIISEQKITKDIRRPAPTVRDVGAKTFGYSVDVPSGYIHGSSYNTPYTKLMAWMIRLWEDAGIATYFTSTYAETAKLLVIHYKNSQKEEEHTTMQRYIRPRLVLREHNPFVKAVMGLCKAYEVHIGEDKAAALWDAGFRSVLDISFASPAELKSAAGVGDKLAKDLIRAIGRSEV